MRRKKTKLERSKKCGNCGIQITDSRYLRKRANGQTWCAWCANPKLRCLTLRQRKIMEGVGDPNRVHDMTKGYAEYTERQVQQELAWLAKQGLIVEKRGLVVLELTEKGRRVLGDGGVKQK